MHCCYGYNRGFQYNFFKPDLLETAFPWIHAPKMKYLHLQIRYSVQCGIILKLWMSSVWISNNIKLFNFLEKPAFVKSMSCISETCRYAQCVNKWMRSAMYLSSYRDIYYQNSTTEINSFDIYSWHKQSVYDTCQEIILPTTWKKSPSGWMTPAIILLNDLKTPQKWSLAFPRPLSGLSISRSQNPKDKIHTDKLTQDKTPQNKIP